MARQARSLDILLAEVNRAAPKRSKVSDGGIGDPRHAAGVSDHNPNGAGVWRARDFTDDPVGGFSARKLATYVAGMLGRHPALGHGAYVIWNRQIISTARLAEGWRRYSGSNAHTKHVHISVGTNGYDNTQSWGWPPKPPAPKVKPTPNLDVMIKAGKRAKLPKVVRQLEAIRAKRRARK